MRKLIYSFALIVLSVVTGTAATFTVLNTNDNGAGTFRQAILDANAAPGTDTIAFNISPISNAWITITGAVFVVTDPVIIDGTTQPGFSGTPVVDLTTPFVPDYRPCLRIEAGNSVVRGLCFRHLRGPPLTLSGGGTNIIEGNFFGLYRDGFYSAGNWYNAITLINSSYNTIGGSNAAQRNIISSSSDNGIELYSGSSHNRIIGNFIGTDLSGTNARPNRRGILVSFGTNNVLGGTGLGESNLISGNRETGVQFQLGESNRIIGNYVGTDVSGRIAMGNEGMGIYVAAENFTVVGGDALGEGNLISGNRYHGIGIQNSNNTYSNRVAGNFIGVDITGTNALPNRYMGLSLDVSGLQLGGGTPGARNVISGNGGDGMVIDGLNHSFPSSIQGNIIGLGADGVTPIPNHGFGMQVIGVSNVVIGGLNPGEGNIVSANTDSGILLAPYGNSAFIAGNTIGLDASGTRARGNGDRGIVIISGTNNTLRANRIAYNATLGIDIPPAGLNTNAVGGNSSRPDPLLNFPIIQSASNTTTNILITATLDAAPGLLYDVEFFLNFFCDPSGFGEGQTFLGSAPVQTDINGHASFNVAMPLAIGSFVTATATAPYGNTSEFSPCVFLRGGTNTWKLTIRRDYTTYVEWPIAAVGYELQSTTSLSPPVQWTTHTNGIFEDGVVRRYYLSQDHKPSRIFFRLIRP